MEAGSVGLVATQYYVFAQPPNPMVLESGEKLGPITLAYETYGKLNADKSNAILICHALSGDAHVAGYNSPTDPKPGWWDDCVGPGKAFDTDRYFVICTNVIGGCKGSTGPGSIDPATGKPYGLSFPVVTIADMVEAQRHLIDHLGIERLLTVVGGSMGGMQALQWAVAYPDRLCSAIPLATTARLSPQSIALDEVGRQAIYSDVNWNEGDYYGRESGPNAGLALARMIGHITYLSDKSMQEKFGRRLQNTARYGYSFKTEFAVESYLQYHGGNFIRRFDANSYLYITKAMDYFDLANGHGSLVRRFAGVRAKILVVSFTSDWLFPSYQAKEIVSALMANGVNVTYCDIDSPYGHDAFLLEVDRLTSLMGDFLNHVARCDEDVAA
jgi:homoserine O-acetyltransferase/O-succinyltransferase